MNDKASRKERTRQYLENPRPMGIYRVRNTVNGKSLIGASVDLPSMLNRQQAQLRMGAHTNRALQSDWNEHGPEAFAFEVVDTLKAPPDQPDYDPASDLKVLEALWLEKLSPFEEQGYNAKPRQASSRTSTIE